MTHSNPFSKYKRRQILRFAGLAAGASILPVACRTATSPKAENTVPKQLATPTTEYSPIAQSTQQNVSKVVLVRSEDRVAGTLKALDLLQPQGISGQTIFLKPNYNTADPAPAATDTKMLEALVKELQSAGGKQITIGDRSGMAETRQAMQKKGVFQLAQRYGLKTIVFDEFGRNFPQQVRIGNRDLLLPVRF